MQAELELMLSDYLEQAQAMRLVSFSLFLSCNNTVSNLSPSSVSLINLRAVY